MDLIGNDIIKNYYNIIEKCKINIGKSNTKNKKFDDNQFLVIKNFVDTSIFVNNPPIHTGCVLNGVHQLYCNKPKVIGSSEIYNNFLYEELNYAVKKEVEKIIGKTLIPTYHIERYCYEDQELKFHSDHNFSEIAVSINIKNIINPWNLNFYNVKTNNISSISLSPGDAVIYKGIEIPHWRNKLIGSKFNKIKKIFTKKKLFHQQIIFYYVISDGYYVEYASTISKNVWIGHN